MESIADIAVKILTWTFMIIATPCIVLLGASIAVVGSFIGAIVLMVGGLVLVIAISVVHLHGLLQRLAAKIRGTAWTS